MTNHRTVEDFKAPVRQIAATSGAEDDPWDCVVEQQTRMSML